jgi:hypothetical protein
MHRYFLHIRNGTELLADHDGQEFDDVAAAEQEAAQSARDLMAECLRLAQPLGLGREMVICDDAGSVVAKVPFAKAIPEEG